MSKRRFIQMHLSTAVVLMLVAGVLVWANVRPQYATPSGEGFGTFGQYSIFRKINEHEYWQNEMRFPDRVLWGPTKHCFYGWPWWVGGSSREVDYSTTGDPGYSLIPFRIESFTVL